MSSKIGARIIWLTLCPNYYRMVVSYIYLYMENESVFAATAYITSRFSGDYNGRRGNLIVVDGKLYELMSIIPMSEYSGCACGEQLCDSGSYCTVGALKCVVEVDDSGNRDAYRFVRWL